VLVGLNSSARRVHLMLFDAATLDLVRTQTLEPFDEIEQHYCFGIAPSGDGWLYTDDGQHALRQLAGDLSLEWETSILELLGRADVGPVLLTPRGSITIDTYRSRLILEADRRIAGSVGTISDVLLTPTSLAWAGDLIAVGLIDKPKEEALLGFYDPEVERFLPGLIPLGKGAVGRIRHRDGRLWVLLPWQGKVVELVGDPR
jgi:hypothetical protein